MYYTLVAWRYIRVTILYKNVEYIGEFNLMLAHLKVHKRHSSNCGQKIKSVFFLNGSGNEERTNRKKSKSFSSLFLFPIFQDYYKILNSYNLLFVIIYNIIINNVIKY